MRHEVKSTKITIYEDKATGVSAVHTGANCNGLAFNLDYIADRDVHLASKLYELYMDARDLPEEVTGVNDETPSA